jgi:hypothetical protein
VAREAGGTVARPVLLLTDPSVYALTQKVGMPAVTGILLDHVHHQLADGDPALAQTFAEIGMVGQNGVGLGLLTLNAERAESNPA